MKPTARLALPVFLLTAGGLWADSDVRYDDLDTGTELTRFEQHAGHISALHVMPGDRRAVSAATDGTIRVWELP